MPTKKTTPSKSLFFALKEQCEQERSGTMYFTSTSAYAAFYLCNGQIVNIVFNATKGIDALADISTQSFDKYIFTATPGNTALPDSENMDSTLPSNQEIFNRLGISEQKQPGNREIFVVEDSRLARKIVVDTLQNYGYRVFESQDGLDALEKLQTLHPDLILMDLVLPKMEGHEVLRQLRNGNFHRDTPVIIMSALGDSLYAKMRQKISGVIDHLHKPIDPDVLLQKIDTLLNSI